MSYLENIFFLFFAKLIINVFFIILLKIPCALLKKILLGDTDQ
jgi:hypothetical protein